MGLLGQAVVRVFHRHVLPVEGQAHCGIKEVERHIGLIIVEGLFEKGLPRAHPKLAVGRLPRKQPLQFPPRPVHCVAVKLHAVAGIQGSLRPGAILECFFRLGGKGVELRQITAMGSENQPGARRASACASGESAARRPTASGGAPRRAKARRGAPPRRAGTAPATPRAGSWRPWMRSTYTRRNQCHLEPSDYSFFSMRSEEHTSELQSPCNLVCRLL